jgi:NAD(P) transhydrogenase subunit beta
MDTFTSFAYLISAICFILSLRGLSHPETANRGVALGMVGMALAIVVSFSLPQVENFVMPILAIAIGGIIGTVIAKKVDFRDLPQLVALFNALIGLAAVLISGAAFVNPDAYGISIDGIIAGNSLFEMSLGAVIGAITFTGSIIAFGKLQGLISGKPIMFSGQHKLNATLGILSVLLILVFCFTQSSTVFLALIILALVLGVLVISPIGGADMPVVISMLNSYSGWAAVGIGFTLANTLLIITGALVGASGAILSYIMCKAMNRSFLNVVLGGFGADDAAASPTAAAGDRPVKIGSADDAGFIMKNASSVIIVPGYGMAVAQAQHALREMVDILKAEGIKVRYAIHPVAGRMPGHMNVLLAEANVPYDDVLELDDINRDFAQTDVAFVIGANDITNPAAKTDSSSPIFGMPILDVEKAKTVLFVKRSLGTGYAGVDNPLFFNENTMMLLGDAKKMSEDIIKAME